MGCKTDRKRAQARRRAQHLVPVVTGEQDKNGCSDVATAGGGGAATAGGIEADDAHVTTATREATTLQNLLSRVARLVAKVDKVEEGVGYWR
jgi:hypothetical protein